MIKQIQIPTTCPTCKSKLEQVNSQLFCRNKECSAQSTKKVQAFVKKMRIKGLGPAAIFKLGFIKPIEIYKTSQEQYEKVLGEKIGSKIFEEVENSCLTTFSNFLSALSIPLIGDSASKKIAAKGFCSVEQILEKEYIDGLGPKAEISLYEYLENNILELSQLENNFVFGVVAPITKERGKVCITGKLNDFSNRSKAKEFLEEQGYTVTSTISKITDYLICEDNSNSSKNKKAESLGIPIVSINKLIGNN